MHHGEGIRRNKQATARFFGELGDGLFDVGFKQGSPNVLNPKPSSRPNKVLTKD